MKAAHPNKKRKKDETRAAKQLEKANKKQRVAATPPKQKDDATDEGIDAPLPWDPLLPQPSDTAADLLTSKELISFSRQAIVCNKDNFTLTELAAVRALDCLLHTRLQAHIRQHHRIPTKKMNHYVWDYCYHNMSRALAWGIMQRHVKINQVADKDDHLTCFIEDPNEFMDEIPRESNGLGLTGGYKVWDRTWENW